MKNSTKLAALAPALLLPYQQSLLVCYLLLMTSHKGAIGHSSHTRAVPRLLRLPVCHLR